MPNCSIDFLFFGLYWSPAGLFLAAFSELLGVTTGAPSVELPADRGGVPGAAAAAEAGAAFGFFVCT